MARSVCFDSSMRVMCLIIGCLATGMAYSMDAFNVYADALKELFQYNQKEVEFIISLGNVGLLSSLPAGLLIRLCGFRLLSFVGLIVSAGSYILLAMATNNVQYYNQKSYLIALYYFFSGAGGGIMYITATTVNVRNFDVRYLGIVSGLLHSMKSAVLGVIMATYQAGFSQTAGSSVPTNSSPPIKAMWNYTMANNTLFATTEGYDYIITTANASTDIPTVKANLTGFFIVIAISYAAVNLLGIIFYGSYPQKPVTILESTPNKSCERHRLLPRKSQRRDTGDLEDILTRSSCSIRVVTTVGSDERYSPLGLLRSYYYHAILWPSVYLIAYRTCYINNLTSFTTAMYIDKYAEGVLLSLVPILGTVVKPVLGVISDALATRIPRSASLLLFLILDGVACILCMTLFSHVSVITIGLVLAIFGSCTVQTQSPAILVETFGKDSFSYGWGFITLSWSLATLCFQMVYGDLYDKAVVTENEIYCYGQQCFTMYFLISACLACLISFIIVYAVIKQYKELKAKRGLRFRLGSIEN